MALRAGPPRAPGAVGGGGPCGEGSWPHCSVGTSGEPEQCRVAAGRDRGCQLRLKASGACQEPPVGSLLRQAPRGRDWCWAHSSTCRLLAGDSAAPGTQEEVVGVSPGSPFPSFPRTPHRGPPSPTQSEDVHGGRRWRGVSLRSNRITGNSTEVGSLCWAHQHR